MQRVRVDVAEEDMSESIEGYVELEKRGEEAMGEDGVRRTELCLIRRCSSPCAEETQAMEMEGLS